MFQASQVNNGTRDSQSECLMSAYSAALKFTYDIGSLYPIEHFLYFSSPLIEFQYHTSAKLALLLVVLLVKTLIRALLGR